MLTFCLVNTILSLITGAKGFLLSASVCNKSVTDVGAFPSILFWLISGFWFGLAIVLYLFLNISWKSPGFCSWGCCWLIFWIFISGFNAEFWLTFACLLRASWA